MKPSPASMIEPFTCMRPWMGCAGGTPRQASLGNASFCAAITVESGRSGWGCSVMVMGFSFEKLKHPSQSPASVMGRASVKGFGQVKNPGEDLILHRVFRHKFRSLLFLFHCTRRSGLKDTP